MAITRLVDGHHIYVDPRDETVSAQLIARGFWEPETYRILRLLTSPGDHVIDVGANLGYYSLAMAERVGHSGSVTAIEANPHMARLATLSLNFNHYGGRASVLCKAAGDRPGTARFTLSSRNGGSGHFHFTHSTLGDDTQVVDVETVRLDDLGLADVKLIRIDAEGSEALVLAGAHRLLERPDIVVCMEWDTIQMGYRSDPAALAAGLARRGFRFWRIARRDEKGPALVEVAALSMSALPFNDVVVSRRPLDLDGI